MATIVESPGITSAKEEVAAILFAREPQATPVMTAPAPEQLIHPVHEQPKYQPSFARYHEPESMPVRPKVVDTTALRPYENFDEVSVAQEPQVVRPYIDSSEYLTSVAATSVAAPTPVETVAEAPKTVTVVESPLDTQLEEDTQYVVKFKKSTIVAATILATIFLLMSILLVVNIVNLVTMSAEVNALTQESMTLEKSLTENKAKIETAKRTAQRNAPHYNVQYVNSDEVETAVATAGSTATDTSFFDWLCKSLSRLFN